MTEVDDFETIDAKAARLGQRLREKRDQAAHRKRAAVMRNLTNLQNMIAELERGILALQLSIDAALAIVRVRDPSHQDYPIVARALAGRRDNLKLTLVALSKRLAELTENELTATNYD